MSLSSYTRLARYHVHLLLDHGERDVYVCNCDEARAVLAWAWNGRERSIRLRTAPDTL
eukprot:COSAG02_NODE_356_length_23978_cov_7.868504_16_plen_58_part_00